MFVIMHTQFGIPKHTNPSLTLLFSTISLASWYVANGVSRTEHSETNIGSGVAHAVMKT
jgi:hypothetical protein